MKAFLLFLLTSALFFSCSSNDIEPKGGNFDQVLLSPDGNTLYIYHSDLTFEGYIPSTNEYIRGMWSYYPTSEAKEGDMFLKASGTKIIACDGLVISIIPPFILDINSLEVTDQDFVSCGKAG
ncbi:hypothetical protein [Flammeovirga kamogawensis]|uniref:Uncharacterized protein n=1 Tax=Flammeovirga kamogawensis TaxID=373891 RepID=A0ABX8GZH0_9BACT|nr:hypothetical protein [Flammeovirga kamogawensis]MBB6459456.1 hypothetical protein [Flammeovirga kamogawensis]QWG09009.1 hypothetical protein KM029_08715 [Flammeovirga kamogawensis]TRX67297.1 hypothetical protein EO216_03755 [Flammeovirga kamogawensis]